ncbi:MAG: hypothetical protein ABUL58_08285 [Steroidobacter sp.]
MLANGHKHHVACALVYIGLMFFKLQTVHAEPYLAIQQGLKCMQCHINPAGGGERNTFGEIFAQNVLPATHIDTGDAVWAGALNPFINMGGNLRADAEWNQVRGQKSLYQFSLEQARVYVSAAMIPDKLIFYVDESLAPGTASNREAWGQVWFDDKTWYIKAGQMYLPFGLRLQDQQAFTREVTGVSMDTPDQGMEIGFEHGPWDAQLAMTNGTGGSGGNNNGKEFTAQLAHVESWWRLGAGININNSLSIGQFRAVSVFAGLHTGPVVWLAEMDNVSFPSFGSGNNAARTTQNVQLLEADWLIRRGHNLKLTAEWLDPRQGQSHDSQHRLSVVNEYAPVQFLQVRLGYRQSGADQPADALHQQQAFMELHAFF